MSKNFIFSKDSFVQGLKNFVFPKEFRQINETFTEDQIKALNDKRTISKLLFHRTYMEDRTNKKMGLYRMADGRVGAIFRVYPPPYLSENVENMIVTLLGSIVDDNTICFINTFASRNCKQMIEEYENAHKLNSKTKLKIKHPEMIESFKENRIEFLKNANTKSLMGEDADLRGRNFINTVSILFPYDTKEFKIREVYNQALGMLRSIGGRSMPSSEFIPLLREFVNPEIGEYELSNDEMTKINKQITKGAAIRLNKEDGSLSFGKSGKWKAKVLTTDKFPKEVGLFNFQNAFFDALGNDYQIHLPGPFMVSLVIKFTNVEKRRKEALSKARWNISQLNGLSLVIEKKNPEIKVRKEESQDVVRYLDQMGEQPLDAMFGITVYEDNIDKLNQNISALKKSFEQIPGRWILKEETFPQTAYMFFMMSLPLNYSEVVHTNLDKMDINFKSNNAQMAPLLSSVKSFVTEDGKPTHAFFDRTGQLFFIDWFSSKANYNLCVIGPMGSGKSFFTNFFTSTGLSTGWDIRLIDFGRSYEKYCENIGGQFLDFPSGHKHCLNFFTNIITKDILDNKGNVIGQMIHEDEFDTIVPVIGLMMGVGLRSFYKDAKATPKDKMYLNVMTVFVINACSRAFEIEGKKAGMKEVRDALIEFKKNAIEDIKQGEGNGISDDHIRILDDMIVGLEPYGFKQGHKEGIRFKYFNGPCNVDFDSSYFITELDDIADSNIMPVVAMSVLQRMAQEAFIGYSKNPHTSRVIGVDEAWRVLKDSLFVDFLEDFSRRIRKYRGLTALITQTIAEFAQNTAAQTMFDTASWKVFLPLDKEMIHNAKNNGQLSLSNFEVKLMESAKSKTPHYNEMTIKHGDLTFIALLKVTVDDYWMFTSKPSERAAIKTVMEEKGYSLVDAVWYLARKAEGLSEAKISYLFSKKYEKGGINNDWDGFFQTVIADNSYVISTQKIFQYDKKESQEIGEEVFMKITHGNDVYNRNYFIEAAKDKGYFYQISRGFLTKCFNYYSTHPIENYVSINLSIKEIKDKQFKRFLIDSINNLGDIKKKFLFEIELDFNAKENYNKLIEFSKEIKRHDVNISFDNVDFSQIDFRSIIELDPKQLKIDINKIKALEEEQRNSFKTLIFLLVEKMNIEVIMTKIENEEDIETSLEFGVSKMQGFKLSRVFDIKG